MWTNQLVDHRKFATVPEALHGMPGMQSSILIIACDGMIIKRQSETLLVVFTLQIVPADREQVGKHLERIKHQPDAAAMTMIDHLHRDGLNSIFQFTRYEKHFHIEAKSVDGQTTENFFRRTGPKAFESTLGIWQARKQYGLDHPRKD